MRSRQLPPTEKYQKASGITLSLRRSDAIHCTRKRLAKRPCPRKPRHHQKSCSVMMSASFDYRLRSSRAQSSGPETAANHLTEHAETPQEFFRFSRAGDRYTASVEPEITAKT